MNWISVASAQSTPSLDVGIKTEAQEVTSKSSVPSNESENNETTTNGVKQEPSQQPENKESVTSSVGETMQEDGKADQDTTSAQNPEEPEPLDVHVDDTQNDLDSDILETRASKAGSKAAAAPGNEAMDTSGGERVPESSTVASSTGNKDSSGPEKADTSKTPEADSTLSSSATTTTAATTARPAEKTDDNKSKRSVGFVWYIVFAFLFLQGRWHVSTG